MREVTATEASRTFSAVLDDAAQGRSTLVTRGGVPIATIMPAPRANGAALRALFASVVMVDDDSDGQFAADVEAARELARAELDEDAWHD